MKKWILVLFLMAVQSIVRAVPVTDGLIIHLDAGSIRGLNDGDPVTIWADLSTSDSVNGNVATMPGWNAPIYQSNGLNGNPVVRMQGGDLLASNPLSFPSVNDGVTIFIVAQGDQSGDAAERILQLGRIASPNTGRCLGADFSTNTTGTDGGSGGRFNNGKCLVRANNPITTGFHIAALQIDQGETYGSLRYFVDDMTAQVFDNTANTGNVITFDTGGNELTVGTGIPSGGGYYTTDDYQGDIAEILIYNSQLSQGQMQQMFDYLTAKYSIFQAWNPAPADGAIKQGVVNGANVDVELTWNTGVDPDNTSAPNPNITTHYLYLQKGEPNFIDVAPQVISAGSPVEATATTGVLTLDFDATYYWRVDESMNNSGPDDPNTLNGPVWSFDTLKSVPSIPEGGSPVDVIRYPYTSQYYEGDAVFTCSFSSINVIDVKWYRVGNPDEALASSGDITIATENSGKDYVSTLTIANVEAGDEGAYYCTAELQVNPDQEPPTVSDSANLGVRRAVGYWPLDGDYVDASGEGHDGDPNIAPDPSQWIDGVDSVKTGSALDLVPNPYAMAYTGDWAPSAYTGQFSVSAWVKWAGANGAWQGIMSNRVVPGDGNFYIEIRQDNGNVQIAAPNFTALQAEPLPMDEWTHVVVTAGPNGHTIYFNGEVKAQRAAGNTITANETPLYIGALQTDATTGEPLSMFNGVMDEVKVYNYALGRAEVAMEYYEISGIASCLTPPALDTNGDCQVDMQDLATFVSSWLLDGLCPGQACP